MLDDGRQKAKTVESKFEEYLKQSNVSSRNIHYTMLIIYLNEFTTIVIIHILYEISNTLANSIFRKIPYIIIIIIIS